MCLASSIEIACDNDTGGISTVYLAQRTEVEATANALVFGTTPNAPHLESVAAGVTWAKIDLNTRETLSQSATSPKNDNRSFTQSVAFQFSGYGVELAEKLHDLNDCSCGYVAIVTLNSGSSLLYGVNYFKATGSYKVAPLYPAGADGFNSGANATESLIFSANLSGVTGNSPLTIDPAVISTLTVLP